MLPNTFNPLCHRLIWFQFFPSAFFLLIFSFWTILQQALWNWLLFFFLPTSETLFSLFRRRAGCYAPHGWGNLLFLSVSPSPPPVFLWIKESFVNTLSACQKELMHNARFVVCLIQKNWLANEGGKKKSCGTERKTARLVVRRSTLTVENFFFAALLDKVGISGGGGTFVERL